MLDILGRDGYATKSALDCDKIGKNYRLAYLKQEPYKFDRLFSMFVDCASESIFKAMHDQFKVAVASSCILAVAATEQLKELRRLAEQHGENSSYIVVAHCLCILL